MFWLASRLFSGFHIDSFAWSIVAALVYSAVSWAVSAVVLRKNA
jgi:putative membrane protein